MKPSILGWCVNHEACVGSKGFSENNTKQKWWLHPFKTPILTGCSFFIFHFADWLLLFTISSIQALNCPRLDFSFRFPNLVLFQ